ncbi:hypothetical protein [Caryophanon tenue]|uniref:Uncharacterized protein n=1 Tax=Caryophanon tenue TaxID=33978 RepID=A0A1C0YEG4_9BACL|nr:hypothetical protein [Caryophanon tenue]OCS85567.1 hypothetical protein A6M13_02600 [Caryophanon tenue]
MNLSAFYMMFLYFPENKTEYIPAFLEFAFFFVLCVIVFIGFQKISKKQELRTKELEQQILEQRKSQHLQD